VPLRLPLGDTRRVHVKDLAQDVTEDVLGAEKDGSVKVFIVKVLILPVAICQRRNPRPTHEPPPRLPFVDRGTFVALCSVYLACSTGLCAIWDCISSSSSLACVSFGK